MGKKAVDNLYHSSNIAKKGYVMSKYLQQINDSVFLLDLVGRLSGVDLSRLDLRTSGDFHHRHNLLVENYEIDIERTPVWAYPEKWRRVLCVGRWIFQPGVYERYEICVSENACNRRSEDCPPSISNHNIMLAGTMATDLGTFPAKARFINRNPDCFEYLYSLQNPQLFEPAQKLYNVLETESTRRRFANMRTYAIPEIKNNEDKRAAQMRLLANLQRTL